MLGVEAFSIGEDPCSVLQKKLDDRLRTMFTG
jgi:hypothetical protein